MSFNDVLKKSFAELMPTAINPMLLLVTLGVALLVGLGIFLIYRRYFVGVVYDHAYNMSLVIMTVLTSLIIVTISSNVALSLGMVGALSIIRYRTAVKNPLDLMFMFWAIASGIAIGAHYYEVGLVSFPVIAVIFAVLSKVRGNAQTFVLVINYGTDQQTEEEVRRQLHEVKAKLRSKITKGGMTELTAELNMKTDNYNLTDRFSNLPGVKDVTLVQYRGSYE